MDIDALETFLAIAELGSFTRAAQRLHRSQPAISRRLDILEHELGAPLFGRLRARARLTEAGRVLLPHAETALAALRDGHDAVRGLQAGIEGTISLALVGTLADTHIVHALRRFAAQSSNGRASKTGASNGGASNVRIQLRTASSREVTDLVRRGEAIIGLRYYTNDRPDLISLPAGEETMLVVAAPDHRLAGRRIQHARLLAGERWLGFPPTPGERDSGHALARQLLHAGLDGADITLIDSLTAQKRLAQAGFGLTLVPESSVRDELRQGTLVALDIPSMRAKIPITAIHRRNGYLSAAAKTLLKLLTEGAKTPPDTHQAVAPTQPRPTSSAPARTTAARKTPARKTNA